ncbi:Leucine-rich repeat receptor protein kinase [Quillaja saponaria]|uniref:Leucine-rich repeat receptor protein kinase n=1 Tax=Quillaja saponaria TaxID=32244 RepID=A0AAD7L3B5_QUISA|nr:Leucine-rich repeat receptor protein kinase [Quillaja saponaria]
MTTIPFVNFMFLALFSIAITPLNFSLCKGEYSKVTCNVNEKQALLKFKKGLFDPTNWLSSWSESNQLDCCSWVGVRCNNNAGRVMELSLGNTFHSQLEDFGIEDEEYPDHNLGGEISSSLLGLQFLTHLNLSSNYFICTQIPSFLGPLRSLTHLDLNDAGFSGLIPHQLGNLSNLHYLGLGDNSGLEANNLHWTSNLLSLEYLKLSDVYAHNYKHRSWPQVLGVLPSSITELHLSGCGLHSIMVPPQGYASIINFTSLRVLDISSNDFNEVSNWPQVFSTLPSTITELHLRGCGLHSTMVPPQGYATIANLTSLPVLDISYNDLNDELKRVLSNFSTSLEILDLNLNYLQGEIQHTPLNFQNLRELHLDDNRLIGQIPELIGRLKNLEYLTLDYNSLTGSVLTSLGNLSSLRVLGLGENKLHGTIPKSLGLLSNLFSLNLGYNSFEGPIDEAHFSKLSKLEMIALSSTNLFLNVSPSWDPPFQLSYFRMYSCKMGPYFPVWLQNQKSLKQLCISNSRISDIVPSWF